MAETEKHVDHRLVEQILAYCKHVAGSCRVAAICVCGNYAFGLTKTKTPIEVLLVIRDFQPRLMNFVKALDGHNVIVFAVDEWVFERDVDKGFLGEALAGLLIFPYISLLNHDYLHVREVKLKKRLILEMLQNLVLGFPELSYEICMKPEYFMYETIRDRARLFPPMIYSLLVLTRKDLKEENIKIALDGFLRALEDLRKEGVVKAYDGCFRISRDFVDKAKNRRNRFINLSKQGPRALFTSLLGIIPNVLDAFSSDSEILFRLQRNSDGESTLLHELEPPRKYLFVPTANGLVSLAQRGDIKTLARKVLLIDKTTPLEIEEIGGVLNDVYLAKAYVDKTERKVVVKQFKDWSSFKWFPLTLWAIGTRTFAVLGRSRLEKECAINRQLSQNQFSVPKILHVSLPERLVFMEYIEGQNVRTIVKRLVTSKDKGKTRKDLKIISRVGKRIAKVHAIGIALGDTKPENVMIDNHGEIYLMDLEQASHNGDEVWDIAEFLYYAGHDFPPSADVHKAEQIAEAFISGYLEAGGDVEAVKKAGSPKYTKVFSVFTLPLVVFTMSNVCGRAHRLVH